MKPTPVKQPVRVLNKKADRLAIARYYLEAELSNILDFEEHALKQAVSRSLAKLSEQETWRLLEALSYTYRMNGVFSRITDKGMDWQEIELPVEAITLSGISPEVNDIIYADDVRRSPLRFAAYLKEYFTRYPDVADDPKSFNSFRPRKQELTNRVLLTRQHKGEIVILDGSHRLMALILAGERTVRAYHAGRNSKPSKSMVGDSVFLTLRCAYGRFTKPAQREMILEVAAMLGRMSTDGRSAVETYWIEHERSPKMKKAGRRVIGRMR